MYLYLVVLKIRCLLICNFQYKLKKINNFINIFLNHFSKMSTQAHIFNTLGVFNYTHDSALNNTITKPQETLTNIFF